jgi:TRAP-type C4-dicarboxylate transport system permease small subunit
MLQRFPIVFDRLIGAVACFILLALLLCVTSGVVTRALDDPLVWSDEVSRFLMIWLAVFGWILATRRRAHVRIRFFQDLLSKQGWKVAEIAIQLALFIFGLGIMSYSVGLVLRSLDLEATTVPISFAWMYAPMILAGAVTAAQALSEIVELCGRFREVSPLNESVVE